MGAGVGLNRADLKTLEAEAEGQTQKKHTTHSHKPDGVRDVPSSTI